MLDFIKPDDSPLLISIMQKVWSTLTFLRVLKPRIRVMQSLIDRFVQVQGQRTIICPNHPASSDGMVLFGLSACLKEPFALLAARDIFGKSNSLQSKWLQKLGCYSVTRGSADIHAFKESCNLLISNKRKIVIFPEGEISHHNSALRPFHKGPELIALASLHAVRQEGSQDAIYLLPIVLKYKYERDISKTLIKALCQVEKRLHIANNFAMGSSLECRLYTAYLALLRQGMKQSPNKTFISFDSLIIEFCTKRISAIEESIGILDRDSEPDLIRRVHLLMNDLSFLRNLGRRKNALAKKYYERLKKIVSFLSIRQSDFEQSLEQESLVELLKPLLEQLGLHSNIPVPDIVEVAAGEPIDASEFMPESSLDRKSNLLRLTTVLRNRMQDTLKEDMPKKGPAKLPGSRDRAEAINS